MSVDVSVHDFESWRIAARGFLNEGRPPDQVNWLDPRAADGERSLFAADAEADAESDSDVGAEARAGAAGERAAGQAQPSRSNRAPAIRVSRAVIDALRQAAMFNDAERWPLMYRILWRCRHGDPSAASPADADGARLNTMVKAIGREIHKMHAFVRFRELTPAPDDGPQFVAWYEPVHDVLKAACPHFQQRMGTTPWMIATPHGTAHCDGKTLQFGAPIERPKDIDDVGEALWLQYYRSTFNPARTNPKMMTQEMPVRYWKNLPEGKLIPGLLANADAGARKVAQAVAVAGRQGTTIAVSAQHAMPERDQPSSLDECRRCELWEKATQAVPGAGPGHAHIMIVGEQPGDQEDLAGKAFIGPAGQLLDRAFAEAGLARDTVYLTNAVKHFKWEPRGKRRIHKTPAQREMLACRYWLEQELDNVAPGVVIVLGATAAKAVLGNTITLAGIRGKPLQHEGRWVVATWHPSYVLRLPDEEGKKAAFADIVDALKQAAKLH